MDAVLSHLTDWYHRGKPALCIQTPGVMATNPPPAVLPGSFNPLHEGHRRLAAVAAEILGQPVAFELSVDNVDKPSLSVPEVHHRLRQFAGAAPVWLTRAPTFRQKAALFPGTVFVIGADTAWRLAQRKYYGDDEGQRCAAFDFIRQHNCRFLVAGRVDAAGRFLGLSDIELPAACLDLFMAIPAERFRHDLSSTELRAPREFDSPRG
jgi:hypothetical protein